MANKINPDVKNSRVSIKGKDIVIDYEFNLHAYGICGFHSKNEMREQGKVPVEMYPYRDDILMGYIPVDNHFGVIDLEALYKWAIEAIEKENDSDDILDNFSK